VALSCWEDTRAGGWGVILRRKVVAVRMGKSTTVTLTDEFGCPSRFVPAVDIAHPRGIKASESFARPLSVEASENSAHPLRAPRHCARPPGVETPGHPRRMAVLARAPAVRRLEVQKRLEAHGDDRLESTNRGATGLLDRGHVGFAKVAPGDGVTGEGGVYTLCRYLYNGSPAGRK